MVFLLSGLPGMYDKFFGATIISSGNHQGIRTFRPKIMCTRSGYWRPVRPDVPARDIFNGDIPARIMDDPANFFFIYECMHFKHFETQNHLRNISSDRLHGLCNSSSFFKKILNGGKNNNPVNTETKNQ